jgi:hypothetical protein
MDRLDDPEPRLNFKRMILEFFVSLTRFPIDPHAAFDLAQTAFNSGQLSLDRFSLFLWIIVQHSEALDGFDLPSVTEYLFSHMTSSVLQPILFVLGLIFRRGLIPMAIGPLFELFGDTDPRIVAAAYFCVAGFAEYGREGVNFCIESRIADYIVIPDGFLAKRECAKCIAGLVVNCLVSQLTECVQDAWIEVLVDVLGSDRIPIIERALFVLLEHELIVETDDISEVLAVSG